MNFREVIASVGEERLIFLLLIIHNFVVSGLEGFPLGV